MPVTAPYGSWASPIDADLITSGLVGFDALSCVGGTLFWLESRPHEQGRVVLVARRDGRQRDLTPPPFNVRSRVHEYGGGAYLACAGCVYFVNFADQDLYRIDLTTAAVTRVTRADGVRFADMAWHAPSGLLFAVGERAGQREPENLLLAVDPASGAVEPIHTGHDFYAAPRVSPDGARLAFLSWDHPNMPWDGTQLHVARIGAAGRLEDDTVVAGGVSESIVQPLWLSDERLVFASDRTGWWNLFAYDASGVYCIHEDRAEYAGPHWSFGGRSFVALSGRHVLARRIEDGEQSLVIVDTEQGFASQLASGWRTFDALTLTPDGVACIAGASGRLSAVVHIDPRARSERVVHESGDLSRYAPWFSAPETIAYPTRDGQRAWACFYAPRNPDFEPLPGSRPPLLVMSHGGPTAAASPTLNLRVQYYTSRGWAVLDVNYRGSTGFGRDYRRALEGNWGIVDVADCEDGVAFLARNDRIDGKRVAIRGGSAGGYTTLAALTFGTTFGAGASWYGIGDLELLAADTHKFESRYTDRLVGPYPEARELYRARSPIHHVDAIRTAIIFLQGLEDRVVPPNQAETMVAALRAKRLPVAYLTFPGEGHGFRDAANIRRAIEAEYLFFARVFGFEPADALPDIEIENLC